MKKYILILFFSFCIFLLLIIYSSPYRSLRPYELFGKNTHPEIQTKDKFIDNRKAILINSSDAENSFYIDQIPVTVKDYKRCLSKGLCNPHHYRNYYTIFFESKFYDIFPVTFINWMDARKFCLAAGGDLPTEQQWNLAAGGDFGIIYPWGNAQPNLSLANIDGYYQSLIPAGWLPSGQSPYGVLDMTGNVREWVLDEIFEDNDNKLLKGGSSNDSFNEGRIEAHLDHGPTSSGFNRGFRCVYPNNINQ